jgi:hypothetical protein
MEQAGDIWDHLLGDSIRAFTDPLCKPRSCTSTRKVVNVPKLPVGGLKETAVQILTEFEWKQTWKIRNQGRR